MAAGGETAAGGTARFSAARWHRGDDEDQKERVEIGEQQGGGAEGEVGHSADLGRKKRDARRTTPAGESVQHDDAEGEHRHAAEVPADHRAAQQVRRHLRGDERFAHLLAAQQRVRDRAQDEQSSDDNSQYSA